MLLLCTIVRKVREVTRSKSLLYLLPFACPPPARASCPLYSIRMNSQILAMGASARVEAKADRDAADARAMTDRIAADARFKAQADVEERRFWAAADERAAERKHVKGMDEMRRQDDEDRKKHDLAMMELKVEARRLMEARTQRENKRS